MKTSKISWASQPTDDVSLMTAVHGCFPGSTAPAVRAEALIASHVPKKHIKDVAQIMEMAWWDYRRMAPGHNFMLFAHTYYNAFRRAAGKILAHRTTWNSDDNHVGLIGPGQMRFTANDIFDRDQRHITGMWRAMLASNSLGIPYDWFCRLGFEVAIDHKWQRLPQPFQLYGEKMGAKILDRWEVVRFDRLILAKHPMFHEKNYGGLPIQDSYRSWLIDEIGDQKRKVPAVMNAVFTARHIPEDLARQAFSSSVVNRAKVLAS